MSRRIIILLNLLILEAFCFSQNPIVDSLTKLVVASKVDTIKVNAFNALFLEFEYEDDLKAQEYLTKALELSKKTGYKKGEATTYAHKGFFAEDKGNYPEALKYYFESLRIWELLNDKPRAADAYFYVGNVYYAQENYDEALKKFTSSLRIYKALDKKRSVGIAFNNIGGVYFRKKNYELALENYNMALEIRKEMDDKMGISETYLGMGNVYTDLKNYDRALEIYFQAIKILEGTSRKSVLAGLYANVGIVYSKLRNFSQSKLFLKKAEMLALEIGYKECLSNSYDALSELDSALGNFKGAYEYHKLHILYSDSLDNEETRKKTIQSQLTYDFEKKEAVATAEHKKELENQELIANEKGRKQKLILVFVSFFLIVVVLFAGFIFRSLRTTRKQKELIEQQKELVEFQKLEVEQQKLIVEEHQKEIIDSITYARRIQQSLLPTEKYIENSFKRLRGNT